VLALRVLVNSKNLSKSHSLRMLSKIVLVSLALGAFAAPQAPAAADQPIPKSGDNGKPNGVFSFEMGKGGPKGGAGGAGGKDAKPAGGKSGRPLNSIKLAFNNSK
jgi:hypothetical protein